MYSYVTNVVLYLNYLKEQLFRDLESEKILNYIVYYQLEYDRQYIQEGLEFITQQNINVEAY